VSVELRVDGEEVGTEAGNSVGSSNMKSSLSLLIACHVRKVRKQRSSCSPGVWR
jgi:hypothetical protein